MKRLLLILAAIVATGGIAAAPAVAHAETGDDRGDATLHAEPSDDHGGDRGGRHHDGHG